MFWSASERNSPAIYLGLSLRLCSNIRKNQNLYDRFKKTFPPKMFHVLYIQTIPNDINWFLQVIQVLCNFFQQEWYWSLIIDLIKLPIILLLPTCGVIELTITPTKPAHWLKDAIKSKSKSWRSFFKSSIVTIKFCCSCFICIISFCCSSIFFSFSSFNWVMSFFCSSIFFFHADPISLHF